VLELRPGDVRARFQRGLCLRSHIAAHFDDAALKAAQASSGAGSGKAVAASPLEAVKKRLDQSQGALQPGQAAAGSASAALGAAAANASSVAFEERHVWQVRRPSGPALSEPSASFMLDWLRQHN